MHMLSCRDTALSCHYYYLIMIGGSDQNSTILFYVVSRRTPNIFSSKCFDLDCVFILNGAPTQDIIR